MIKRRQTKSADPRVAACIEDISFIMQAMRAQAVRESGWLSLDLSMAQVKALMALVHGPAEGATSRELGRRLGIGPSAVTPLVDKLLAHKLVTREGDPADRRVVRVRATAKAHALIEKLQLASRALWGDVLAEVPAGELPAVQKGLAVIAGVVRKRGEA